MRPIAASRSTGVSRPFSTNLVRLFSMAFRARSSAPAVESTSRTDKPAWVNTWAIPWPIVPAPTTPIRLICIDGRMAESRGLWQDANPAVGGIVANRRDAGNESSDSLDCECDAVAAAEAQCRDAASRGTALHGVNQRRQHARAAGADGVPERDGAAVHVDAGRIDAELAHDGDGLHRERLVDL